MSRQTVKDALRRILSNIGSIILALLLAVAVWIAATLEADPFEDREYVDLPVTVVNQPEDTLLLEGDGATVSVTVSAQQSVFGELEVGDFHPVIDLSNVDVGVNATVPISVTVAHPGVRIERVRPESVPLRLEAVAAITLPVQIDVVGQVPIGYQAYDQTVTPPSVRVSGPFPTLQQVTVVSGTLDITGARDDVIQRLAIVPRDANGRAVSGVEWDPQMVQVSVDIQRRVGYKPEVEVVPDLRGEPAAGYRRGSVSVLPSTVTLAGPTSILDSLPSFVKTLPITISSATDDLSMRVPLTVPNSVVVVETNFVTVTVDILPILSSRSVTGSVQPQGLRRIYTATLSPTTVEVVLEGPETQLDELTPESLRIYVDLSDLDPGMHRVDPLVLAPPNIRVVSVIPETIEVRIQLLATPTPVPIPLSTAPP